MRNALFSPAQKCLYFVEYFCTANSFYPLMVLMVVVGLSYIQTKIPLILHVTTFLPHFFKSIVLY